MSATMKRRLREIEAVLMRPRVRPIRLLFEPPAGMPELLAQHLEDRAAAEQSGADIILVGALSPDRNARGRHVDCAET